MARTLRDWLRWVAQHPLFAVSVILAVLGAGALVIYLATSLEEFSGDEQAVIALLHSLYTAENTYASRYQAGFTDDFEKLATPPSWLEGEITYNLGKLPPDWRQHVAWKSATELSVYGYRVIERPIADKSGDLGAEVSAVPLGGSGPSFFQDQENVRVNRKGPDPGRGENFPYDQAPELASLEEMSSEARLAYAIVLRFGSERNHRKPRPRNFREWALASGRKSAENADLLDVPSHKDIHPYATFSKHGYNFTYQAKGQFPEIKQYVITADPVQRGKTGQKSFYMDETGVVRWNDKGKAAGWDEPI